MTEGLLGCACARWPHPSPWGGRAPLYRQGRCSPETGRDLTRKHSRRPLSPQTFLPPGSLRAHDVPKPFPRSRRDSLDFRGSWRLPWTWESDLASVTGNG